MNSEGRLVENGAITALTRMFDEKRLRLNSATLLALKGLAGHGLRFILSGAVAKEAVLHMDKAAGVAPFPNSSAR